MDATYEGPSRALISLFIFPIVYVSYIPSLRYDSSKNFPSESIFIHRGGRRRFDSSSNLSCASSHKSLHGVSTQVFATSFIQFEAQFLLINSNSSYSHFEPS